MGDLVIMKASQSICSVRICVRSGRKITKMVKEDEGACSLVNCLGREPTGPRRQLRPGQTPGSGDGGTGQERKVWGKHTEDWKIGLDCVQWEIGGLAEKVPGVTESRPLLWWCVIILLLSF